MRTLYTNGNRITKTIAQFESWDAIRYSATDQVSPVDLVVSDAGALDLHQQLGAQNSTIYATTGAMQIFTGDGDDRIFTSNMDDTIYGGNGADQYFSGLGSDLIYGGAGKDTVYANWQRGSRDSLFGGGGDDTFIIGLSHLEKTLLDAGDGIDRLVLVSETTGGSFAIRASWSIEEISGSVVGSSLDDTLDFAGVLVLGDVSAEGGFGNDLISVIEGSGSLHGGDGNDTLHAGNLGSTLSGGAGLDVIYGSVGNDRFDVTFDDLAEDSLYGGGGSDTVSISGGYAHAFSLLSIASWASTIIVFLNEVNGTAGNDLIDFGGLYVESSSGFDLVLLGDAGNDRLTGSSRHDILSGGTGRDTMDGRGGDDDYFVDSVHDLVLEDASAGYDSVHCSVRAYTLPEHVEHAVFIANGTILAYGNAENNLIEFYSSDGAEVFGYSGDDTLGGSLLSYGGAGNDFISAVSASSKLYGGSGNDFLSGWVGDDLLYGGSGSDSINGGKGNDSLYGSGNDVLDGAGGSDSYYAREGDIVSEYELQLNDLDNDIVYADFAFWTLGSGIETYVSRTRFGAHIIGNSLANTITGSSFNDTLEGAAGDTLYGGDGDDTYVVPSDGIVTIVESTGGGIDRVVSGGYYYVLGANIEQLDFTADLIGTSNLRGNDLANLIIAHAGKDTIDGGLGADTMDGGEDDDTYIIDSAADLVLETGTTSNDEARVYSSAWKLTKGVEDAIVEGALDTTLIGNALDNLLIGFNGADTLQGGAGNDIVVGWAGHDLLTGNSGSDIFAFDIAPLDLHSDIVTDFVHGSDAIFLASTNSRPFNILPTGQLAAADFKMLGSGPLDASDRVLYDGATGTLYFDQDGSGAAAAVRFAVLSNLATVDASDIWVY